MAQAVDRAHFDTEPANRRRRAVLVFFTRATSGPGRRMESLIAHVEARERKRLSVLRVDVDEKPRLAAKLGVSQVPTLVLIKDRRAVHRLEGRATGSRIGRMLDAHLGP